MNFRTKTIFPKGQSAVMGLCAFSPECCGFFVLLSDGGRFHLKMIFCPASRKDYELSAIGAVSTLTGQEFWYRGQQVYNSAQQTYYSAMRWAATPQGQEVLQNAGELIGGWFPGGPAPTSWAGFLGETLNILVGSPDKLVEDVLRE